MSRTTPIPRPRESPTGFTIHRLSNPESGSALIAVARDKKSSAKAEKSFGIVYVIGRIVKLSPIFPGILWYLCYKLQISDATTVRIPEPYLIKCRLSQSLRVSCRESGKWFTRCHMCNLPCIHHPSRIPLSALSYLGSAYKVDLWALPRPKQVPHLVVARRSLLPLWRENFGDHSIDDGRNLPLPASACALCMRRHRRPHHAEK